MDSSGRIHEISSEEERERLEKIFGKLVAVPPDMVEEYKKLSDEQRRELYAKQVAFNAHVSDMARNAAKRERKERK